MNRLDITELFPQRKYHSTIMFQSNIGLCTDINKLNNTRDQIAFSLWTMTS